MHAHAHKQVVQAERPELYAKRYKVVEDIQVFLNRVKAVEDDMISRLSGISCNLLEDPSLIDTLYNANKNMREAQEKLKAAMDVETRLKLAFEDYRSAVVSHSHSCLDGSSSCMYVRVRVML